MSLLSSVGVSTGADSYTVGANACQDALDHLNESDPNVFMVFSSAKYDQEKMLAGVKSVAKNALIVGCSTAGEIATNGPVQEKSVAVIALKSDTVKFYVAVGEDIKADARRAGKKVAEELKKQAGEPLKAAMIFPDVLQGNGSEVLRGAQDELGNNFPVFGGAAGDDFKFEKTYQYLNDKVYSGAVVGIGLVGNLVMGVGVGHGWIPIGIPKKVTKSSGSVLYELDGKPAIEIYDEYFGDAAREMRNSTLAKLAVTYPLGIRGDDPSVEMLIRDPLSVDEKGVITCAAEIPEGSVVQLMIGSREEAIKVATEAATKAREQLEGKAPKAVFIFNCIARSKLFGERVADEINAIQNAIGSNVPLIGFYTYGEIAPIRGELKNAEMCHSVFHNETAVVVLLGE